MRESGHDVNRRSRRAGRRPSRNLPDELAVNKAFHRAARRGEPRRLSPQGLAPARVRVQPGARRGLDRAALVFQRLLLLFPATECRLRIESAAFDSVPIPAGLRPFVPPVLSVRRYRAAIEFAWPVLSASPPPPLPVGWPGRRP